MKTEYAIQDISGYAYLEPEWRGTTEAVWLEHNGIQYLWKNELHEDLIFNEIMAYEIASQLGLESAACSIACYEGKLGVLSTNVNEYGCEMINILEMYPHFTLIENRGYTLSSFREVIKRKKLTGVGMSYRRVIQMLLFDFLIENIDRHYGNIGVDSRTGDIAPFYDHAAGLSLYSLRTESLLYTEAGRRLHHKEIPAYLAEQMGISFLVHASDFYKKCLNLNIHDVLLKLYGVMGRAKYERYADELPVLIEKRVARLKEVLTTAMEGVFGNGDTVRGRIIAKWPAGSTWKAKKKR